MNRPLTLSIALMLGLATTAVAGDSFTTPRIAEVPGTQLTYTALTPDRQKLYSINFPPLTDDAQGEIVVVGTVAMTEVARIQLDLGFPLDLAINRDGTLAYVAVSQAAGPAVTTGPNRLDIIEIATDTLIGSIPITGGNPWGPSGVALTNDGTKAYVGDRGFAMVWVVDLVQRQQLGGIPVNGEPADIRVSPSGRHAFALDRAGFTVTAIEVSTDTVLGTAITDLAINVDFSGIAFSKDESLGYVVSVMDSRIAVLDLDPNSPTYLHQIDAIQTSGDRTGRPMVTRDGRRCLFASRIGATNQIVSLNVDPTSPGFHTIEAQFSTTDFVFDVATAGLGRADVLFTDLAGAIVGLRMQPGD